MIGFKTKTYLVVPALHACSPAAVPFAGRYCWMCTQPPSPDITESKAPYSGDKTEYSGRSLPRPALSSWRSCSRILQGSREECSWSPKTCSRDFNIHTQEHVAPAQYAAEMGPWNPLTLSTPLLRLFIVQRADFFIFTQISQISVPPL